MKSNLQGVVLILKQMFVDYSMETDSEFLQHLCQVLAIDRLLDLRNADVDMLTDGRAGRRGHGVNVGLGLEIGLLLLALKINFHPVANRVQCTVDAVVEFPLDGLDAEPLLVHAVSVLRSRNNIRHDVRVVCLLHQQNNRVCLLNDIEEVDLRRRLRVSDWNGLNAEVDCVVAMLRN